MLALLSSCATAYHQSRQLAATCDERFILFSYFAGCVRHQLEHHATQNEYDQITARLERLRSQVDAELLTDADAKQAFIRYVAERADQIDSDRLMTGLAIGVVSVAVLATAGALDSAGGAATVASTPTPPQVVRGDAGGCCRRRHPRTVGDRIQCRDASYSLDRCPPSGIIHHQPGPDRAAAAGTRHLRLPGSSVLCCDGETSSTCGALTPTTRGSSDRPPLGRVQRAAQGATTAPARRRLAQTQRHGSAAVVRGRTPWRAGPSIPRNGQVGEVLALAPLEWRTPSPQPAMSARRTQIRDDQCPASSTSSSRPGYSLDVRRIRSFPTSVMLLSSKYPRRGAVICSKSVSGKTKLAIGAASPTAARTRSSICASRPVVAEPKL